MNDSYFNTRRRAGNYLRGADVEWCARTCLGRAWVTFSLVATTFLLAVIGSVISPQPARAQTVEEFRKLKGQCWGLIRAGRYPEAEQLAQRLHQWARGPLRDEPLRLADVYNTIGSIHTYQGRFAQGASLYAEALTIRRKALGDEHPHVAQSLNNLGVVYKAQGRYADVETMFEEALEIERKAYGKEHPDVAQSLNNLANLYSDQGRYAEAEPLHRQALKLRLKAYGREHPDVAQSLNNLANLYWRQGQYAEAEPLHRQALEISRKAYGDEHPNTAKTLHNLAILYFRQGRYMDAELLYKQALTVFQNVYNDEHPHVAAGLDGLALLYTAQGRFAEAQPLYERALQIACETQDAQHPSLARILGNMATLHHQENRYGEAEPLYKQALEIHRNAFGEEHPLVASGLYNLADVYIHQGRYPDAETFVQQALVITERGYCEPLLVSRVRWGAAKLAWATNQPQEAVISLKQAWEPIEWQRAHVAGSDFERAHFFARWTHVFEQMVAWQEELGESGQLENALEAMERGRARMLLDQINAAGLDLLAGVPEEEAQPLRQREAEAAGHEASLRRQLEVLPARQDLSDAERAAERERLLAELREARAEYADAYAAIRSASPAYRLAVGADLEPVTLDRLAEYVDRQEALVLEYLLGTEGGYVLVIPAGGPPRLEALTVNEVQAERLGVAPGPLTAERMQDILMREDETGVLDHLRASHDPQRERQAAEGLAVLWDVLVPEGERKALVEGEYKRLVALPDAALAMLPFETLVVERGERPRDHKYLLDVGPPVIYAPSATILVNLAERQDEAKQPAEQPVLSIGDCRYGPSAAPPDTLLADLAPQTRYAATGGHLAPLKYAAWEVQWVADVFQKRGVQPALLRGDAARERAVRRYAPGRRILHFATHGLVDQQYGNLFGALALTPGPRPDDPADDGYLTLAEIYELDLAGCELAILSACETNVGPHQRGEGVWSLARGFLTAGARRVAATTWLLDDRVAASTVSYFSAGIARQKASGGPVDYAVALHEAKRWARQQDEWSAPYYWAPMVLIGPE